MSTATAVIASPTPAAQGRHHRSDVQGLRAIAVLMVVCFHAGLPAPGGFVGVDVFFVISGFVITAMLMREWSRDGRIRFGRFYVRRFTRLAPALALTVGVVMLASFLLLSPFGGQETASKTGLGALLLAANFVIARTTGDYFDASADNNPLLNLWSLSVEEQFYLVFPFVLLLGWLIAAHRKRLHVGPVVAVGTVGAVSLALALIGAAGFHVPGVPDDLVGFYGPATRVWEFAAGALLALGGARLSAASARSAIPVSIVGAGLLGVSLLIINDTTPFPGPWTLLPVLGTVFLIAAGPADTVVTKVLASAPMVWIGDRSYSIYLWHWPCIVFARLNWSASLPVLVLAAAASFIPAYASYRWVEQPVRTKATTGGTSFVRLVALTMAPPLVVAGALGYAADHELWSGSVRDYRAMIRSHHAGDDAHCTTTMGWTAEACTWNQDAAGPPIYLVGDSNADHFSEAMMDASTSLARPLVMRLEAGCSYILGESTLTDRDWRGRCNRYPVQAQDYLLGAEKGVVVIANAYGDFRKTFAGERNRRIDVAGKASETELFSRLTDTIRPLQEAGHEVLLVQTVPHWGGAAALNWQACTTVKLLSDGCQQTMPIAEVTVRQGDIAHVVSEVTASTGAGVLDLTEAICPAGICSAVSPEGLVRYRDGVHITVDQSHALAPFFEAAIARVS
ncbi:acyltransferase family protein [Tessaracoccus antarcticus]|uniref:acyltransferase family protein n=1 Tax=Tessaracoccus antarcticus TaxID=2479848 RepID=UPI001314A678|nr:acyltransferase family protein [Tessaracoccus antarcticus]